LAIEEKPGVGIGVQAGQQIVQRRDQAREENAVRQIPFPIPVRMRDQVKGEPGHRGNTRGSVVASERLGLKPGTCWTMLEDVDDAKSGGETLDPAFQELQVGSVSQAHGIETVGFAPGDVAGSRPAGRVCILMVTDQCLPVGVTCLLD
jgi:hypothetical protein